MSIANYLLSWPEMIPNLLHRIKLENECIVKQLNLIYPMHIYHILLLFNVLVGLMTAFQYRPIIITSLQLLLIRRIRGKVLKAQKLKKSMCIFYNYLYINHIFRAVFCILFEHICLDL